MTETPRSTAVEHAVLGEACRPDGQWRSKMEAIAQRFTVTHKKPPIAPFIVFRAFLALPAYIQKSPMSGEMGVFFRCKEYNLCITKALPRILCIHNFG